MVKAITTVNKNDSYFTKEVKDILNSSIFNINETKNATVKLSDREIEVLKLVSQEKSTQEIAIVLFLSVNTIETHRKNLMRKIGTKNMIGLVKYAIQQGII